MSFLHVPALVRHEGEDVGSRLHVKMLLQNVFFRWALCHAQVRFIGRLDDDMTLNISDTVLVGMRHAPWRCPIVYSDFAHWYSFTNETFKGACYDFKPAPRCPRLEGPFLFPNGPFAIYTRAAASAAFLAPRVAADEARLLRGYQNLGKQLDEDVYAGALLHTQYGHAARGPSPRLRGPRAASSFGSYSRDTDDGASAPALTLIQVPFWQWSNVQQQMPRVGVLHGVKNESHRALVGRLLPLHPLLPSRSRTAPLRCQPLNAPHCCSRHILCRPNIEPTTSPAGPYVRHAFRWPG